ncbi:hypothetical protein AC625_01470 [Peribacillus loiseleuriae]|uniref:Uncharacterized protein n=1 Tax=Peribacillus loiseleuriae TaxID=1679170 RepID=A0A0K9GQ13_9BACI|nr:hypothetical protein AC625_01470 [Peribacillus loiseleuriae]
MYPPQTIIFLLLYQFLYTKQKNRTDYGSLLLNVKFRPILKQITHSFRRNITIHRFVFTDIPKDKLLTANKSSFTLPYLVVKMKRIDGIDLFFYR